MKKRTVLFSIAFLATIMLMNAQSDFGIKAGLSYNSNGDLKEFTTEVDNIYKNEGKGKSGFNVGFYGKLDLGPIYLRPELVYTKTTSEYTLNTGNTEDYKLSKIDVPVLVGIKLIGPLNVFAGPAFQYVIDNKIKGLSISDVENEFSVGMNIGASIEFGRIGIDVRYERGLSENEANWTNAGDTFKLDSRPEQLIFSLSYSLSKGKN
ncbi:outer membrane protein with beta-barrel domain [Lutibacter oceani]|uniref:Outer membrane protein with beta-barrel domain n=1 Tax=Lutibacter oceani TaxID=1853311 RepID=A0A3D9RQQ9_9FLAO|nr:porin family protein [Lutibacter oceani]REE81808.1 outer membrane protein with beta-barrel domain [Lutibacter oceani]